MPSPVIASAVSMQPDGSLIVVLDMSPFSSQINGPAAVNLYATSVSNPNAGARPLFSVAPWDGNTTLQFFPPQEFVGQDLLVTATAFIEGDPSDPMPAHVTLPAPIGLAALWEPDSGTGPSVNLQCNTIAGGNSGSAWFNNGVEIGRNMTPPAIAFTDPNPGDEGTNVYTVAWVDVSGTVGCQSVPVSV